MTNHVHLLLTPERADDLAPMMQRLGQRYTQYANRRYRRSGTLWEGRYRSCMIDSVEYLLRCQRYIELNPVRARMVDQPWQYEWSSYRANAMGGPSDLLVPHTEYVALGTTLAERMRRYRELFRELASEGELQEIRDAVNGGHALGRKSFVESIEAQLHRRATRGVRGRPGAQGHERDCTE